MLDRLLKVKWLHRIPWPNPAVDDAIRAPKVDLRFIGEDNAFPVVNSPVSVLPCPVQSCLPVFCAEERFFGIFFGLKSDLSKVAKDRTIRDIDTTISNMLIHPYSCLQEAERRFLLISFLSRVERILGLPAGCLCSVGRHFVRMLETVPRLTDSLLETLVTE
ncbi:hypothetical protein BC939DRAFT_430616 [Gamsiella multidivaricata]|uniref:uncharacterized protein n=1 Tax=Gamsiella multidivaricata TaxID=101098 RepID=UPI002220449D|nr:uncharacterized protein BC939DRAFT_430616 [Gamsiella multidivaricata]KAI7815752.1 hypothetical protein BC939DRAFT_430616 [Gamsiella multidivaricata]